MKKRLVLTSSDESKDIVLTEKSKNELDEVITNEINILKLWL